MSLSLTDINKVKAKARYDLKKPGVVEALRGLFKHMEQLRNPDLQFVPITGSGADEVIADVGAKLYALYLRKPTASTTDAWFKISNHATTASANGDLVVYLRGTDGGGKEHCMTWNDGLPFGTGLTAASHTANNGAVASAAADQPTGFAIIGAL